MLSPNPRALEVTDVAALTHPGHVRQNNEDQFLISRFGRSLETIATSLHESVIEENYSVSGYGLIVADGVGGAVAGELASSMAIARLIELVINTPDWILSLRKEVDVATVLDRMQERFTQIDRTIRTHATRDRTLQGMGTTMTCAAILSNDLVIGHIGDSRAYLKRGDNMRQLTSDHTLAQSLVDAGVVSPDDPATKLVRHVLIAALGATDNQVKPQAYRLRLAPSDQLLLCTDGLTNMVDDKTISAVLESSDSAQGACDALMNLALAAGGLDNITLVLARFGINLNNQDTKPAAA